jgi:dipeptidyl aminopeptidase/acylaminoacyl peptidase
VARDATELEWSADGRYLLALSPTRASLFSDTGEVVSRTAFPAGEFATDGALSPDGSTLALVLGGRIDQVVLDKLSSARATPHRLLSGAGLRQVLWSPDGQWLLISWPAANQLVFARVKGGARTAAVSHIAQQFGRGEFPQLEGWCCTAHGR